MDGWIWVRRRGVTSWRMRRGGFVETRCIRRDEVSSRRADSVESSLMRQDSILLSCAALPPPKYSLVTTRQTTHLRRPW
jgi:hypothetical protein